MNAVIYARYSSDNQSEESITAQLRACNEYACKNGIKIIGEYIDRAMSARSDNRPEFLRMVAEAPKGLFNAVIVHKLDRFSRDRYDHAIYRKKLRDNNVKVISVLENLDDSPESVVLESVLEGFSEYYSRNLARETRKGLRETALKAKFTGGTPPFGFDVDADNNYIINASEAEAVRKIFNACVNKIGYAALIDEFAQQGIKTKFGRPFGKNSFNAILKNEKYIGTYIYYPEGTAKQKLSIPIKIEDAIPQIVDKTTFWEVQKIMNSRKHSGAAKAIEPYLLSGLLFCGECGSAMNGHRHTRKRGVEYCYECGNNSRKRICAMPQLSRDKVEKIVCDYISDLMCPDAIAEIKHALLKNADILNEDSNIKRQETKKQISALETKINHTVDLLVDTPSDRLRKRLLDMETQQKDLYIALDKLQASEVTEDKLNDYIVYIDGFSDLPREQKLIYVRRLIKKVTAHLDGNIEIETTYGEIPLAVGGATQI